MQVLNTMLNWITTWTVPSSHHGSRSHLSCIQVIIRASVLVEN
jgi:hypothetical protein